MSYFFDSLLAKKNPLTYVKDKKVSSKAYINYMMIRLQKMFKYENLPDTIPREMLEYYLLTNGTCFITKVNDDMYALLGSYGGEPDPYYRPTRYIVANPALKLSADYDINTDGVLMRNDSLWLGLFPLMSRYATMMAENLLTVRSADVMLRILAMLTAPDDKTKLAAEAYLKKLEDGEFGVIAENRFFDGVKMQSPPSNNGSYLTQFIELQQYLKGSFYNEIGLNANFNMKREALGDGEASLNEDSLLPLCEEMLRCRREDIEKVNALFGTNITVDFDSAWANNEIELDLSLEQMANEASQLAESGDSNDNGESGEPGNNEDSEDGNEGTCESSNDDSSDDDNSHGEQSSYGKESGSPGDSGENVESLDRPEATIEIDINIDKGDDEDESDRDGTE